MFPFLEKSGAFSDALESLAGMARLAGLALEPLEGTCGAGGITVKRPCYLFPSVIGKVPNREEGGCL